MPLQDPAASFPHCHGLPSRRQSCRLPGASIPCGRILLAMHLNGVAVYDPGGPVTSARTGVAISARTSGMARIMASLMPSDVRVA